MLQTSFIVVVVWKCSWKSQKYLEAKIQSYPLRAQSSTETHQEVLENETKIKFNNSYSK